MKLRDVIYLPRLITGGHLFIAREVIMKLEDVIYLPRLKTGDRVFLTKRGYHETGRCYLPAHTDNGRSCILNHEKLS